MVGVHQTVEVSRSKVMIATNPLPQIQCIRFTTQADVTNAVYAWSLPPPREEEVEVVEVEVAEVVEVEDVDKVVVVAINSGANCTTSGMKGIKAMATVNK